MTPHRWTKRQDRTHRAGRRGWRTVWECRACGSKVGVEEKTVLRDPTKGQLKCRKIRRDCGLQLASSVMEC